jgi:uncharacterized protein YjbI with pentapeptide repeats
VQALFIALAVLVGWVASARAEEPGLASPRRAIASVEEAADVEDPAVLVREGDRHRASGNVDLARQLYARAVAIDEFAQYFRGSAALVDARVDELAGDWAAAAARYRAAALEDPLYAVIALRSVSEHPDRDALVKEILDAVRATAARAAAGATDAKIYTTSKGEPRFLERIDSKDVARRLREDPEHRLRYCYADAVDLSAEPDLPPRIEFDRCVIGSLRITDRDVGTLVLRGFVLGDVDVGKTWQGEVNKSPAIPGSRFEVISARETVFLGRANFVDVTVSGRKAAFPLAVFEGPADFRGARFEAPLDFRYSAFSSTANFKRARLDRVAYFGHARFGAETSFAEVLAKQDAYFDSARFDGPARFDACEWQRRLTFEAAIFAQDVAFSQARVDGRVNFSRARLAAALTMKEVRLGGMDFIGATLEGDASFVDARIDGKVRFSLDDVTRARHLRDPSPLLPLYRDYQGDEDREDPLAARTAYGVEHVDDLVARVGGNLRFSNTTFGGFVVFDRVTFGRPGASTTAEFYNSQFGGETHFERTTWFSNADFTTIFAQELALNEATFHSTLVLDDANVPGRVTLTDASFEEDATLSFYGAEIGSFQVSREQVEGSGQHRLWYERCADGAPIAGDVRLRRMDRGYGPMPEDDFRAGCRERAVDELVGLKQSFGDRAMTSDEDWAYWWIKHVETLGLLEAGGLSLWSWPIRFFVFELAFGWGVRLGNLFFTALFVIVAFAVAYKRLCPDAVMSFDGENVSMRDIPWHGALFVSAQALGAFNTGWDYGKSPPLFKMLNTAETFSGVVIITFFVGAYTRMILA